MDTTQQRFLKKVKDKKIIVEVELANGISLKGKLITFDKFSILLEDKKFQYLIFKHSILFISFKKY